MVALSRTPPGWFYGFAASFVLLGVLLIGLSGVALLLYLGLWLFFVGFNYLEATLPSLVSKVVFAGGKGTALGVYSTCQFLGAFFGGALGGWLLGHFGATGLIAVCAALALTWLLLALPAAPAEVGPVRFRSAVRGGRSRPACVGRACASAPARRAPPRATR